MRLFISHPPFGRTLQGVQVMCDAKLRLPLPHPLVFSGFSLVQRIKYTSPPALKSLVSVMALGSYGEGIDRWPWRGRPFCTLGVDSCHFRSRPAMRCPPNCPATDTPFREPSSPFLPSHCPHFVWREIIVHIRARWKRGRRKRKRPNESSRTRVSTPPPSIPSCTTHSFTRSSQSAGAASAPPPAQPQPQPV